MVYLSLLFDLIYSLYLILELITFMNSKNFKKASRFFDEILPVKLKAEELLFIITFLIIGNK